MKDWASPAVCVLLRLLRHPQNFTFFVNFAPRIGSMRSSRFLSESSLTLLVVFTRHSGQPRSSTVNTGTKKVMSFSPPFYDDLFFFVRFLGMRLVHRLFRRTFPSSRLLAMEADVFPAWTRSSGVFLSAPQLPHFFHRFLRRSRNKTTCLAATPCARRGPFFPSFPSLPSADHGSGPPRRISALRRSTSLPPLTCLGLAPLRVAYDPDCSRGSPLSPMPHATLIALPASSALSGSTIVDGGFLFPPISRAGSSNYHLNFPVSQTILQKTVRRTACPSSSIDFFL